MPELPSYRNQPTDFQSKSIDWGEREKRERERLDTSKTHFVYTNASANVQSYHDYLQVSCPWINPHSSVQYCLHCAVLMNCKYVGYIKTNYLEAPVGRCSSNRCS